MTIDKEKVRQKLQFMKDKLRDIQRFQGLSLDEFKADVINEDAAIRMLQVIIEAMLDISAHIIAREGWGMTKAYTETIEIIVSKGLLPPDMEDTFKKIVRFRNRVVHLYYDVDSEEILDIINNRLDDFRPFITGVVKRYFNNTSSSDIAHIDHGPRPSE